MLNLTAFILYRQHHQASVVAQNPGLANPQISKVIGDHWRTAPDEIKNHWRLLAEVCSAPDTIPDTFPLFLYLYVEILTSSIAGREDSPSKAASWLSLPTSKDQPRQQRLHYRTSHQRSRPSFVTLCQVRRPLDQHLHNDI